MIDISVPWQIVVAAGVPAIGTLFALVLHTRKTQDDLRVELADYKTHVAERYVTHAAQDAFEHEVVRRLERIEDKLDAQAQAFATSLARLDDA